MCLWGLFREAVWCGGGGLIRLWCDGGGRVCVGKLGWW